MDDRTAAAPRLTTRAVASGLAFGTLVCLVAPYNDLAMQNTPLIGNSLPLASTVLVLLFVATVNAALRRWRPARAWSAYELATAYALMLVMSALPSTGLMRYLLPNLAVPFRTGLDQAGYRELIGQLTLASWVFPTFSTPERLGDPIAVGFYDGWSDPTRSPYAAWIVPFFAWGLFLAALAWSLLCASTIVLRQWRDHEHLAFPLASVQLSLLEAPSRGRAFNRTLRARSFWVAFGLVFLLHAHNGLATYFPKHLTTISRGFDFTKVLADRPWTFLDVAMLKATVYFTMVGVSFFLSAPVAFSLWFALVLLQFYKVAVGVQTGDASIPGINDQRLGVAISMLFTIAWLGRRQWALVVRQAFRGPRAGESRGTYLSYRAAFWGLVGGMAGMTAWLVAAGVTVVGALTIVLGMIVAFVLVARLVAETGVFHAAMPVSVLRPFEYASVFAGWRAPVDTVYAASLAQATFYDYRETLSVYATHAMRDLDATKPAVVRAEHDRRLGRRVIALFAVALVVAYGTSFWSSLWTHYNYAVTLDANPASPIDPWGTRDNPRWQVLDPGVSHVAQNYIRSYDRADNLLLGFTVASGLSVLRLTFSWWPLHPAGYLLLGLPPCHYFWFSIFLGWLAKLVVLRVGGGRFYERCKPAFLGLVFGELSAGVAWMVASHALHALGLPYQSYLVLPQ